MAASLALNSTAQSQDYLLSLCDIHPITGRYLKGDLFL